jgi:glucose-1-phosphate thymidylyltransferase
MDANPQMKGVILAGGTGTRLSPLTLSTNKHLLPIGPQQMIVHCINKMVECDILDILIITGDEHMGDMIRLLGSGKRYGCSFTYKVQDVALGIAHALSLAEGFCGNDRFVVMLGDNILQDSIIPFKAAFEKSAKACMLLLKSVEDPSRFGVARFTPDGTKIMEILEKPQDPPSDLCVTGIYFYSPSVFSIIKNLKKSARGEYEISDVNSHFVTDNDYDFRILGGWWTDAGTHESYQKANRLVAQDG